MNTLNVIVLALSAMCAVTAAQEDTIECPLICPDSFVPTCATDGSEYVQFDNPCALDVFNCNRARSILPSYAKTDIDWCTTTELNEYDAGFTADLEESDTACLTPCPTIFSPICGSNGTYRKVFSNECEMNTFNCLYKTMTKSNWRLLKQGKCSQSADDEW